MIDHPYIIGAALAVTYLVLPVLLVLACVMLFKSRMRERGYGDALRGIADQTKAVGTEAVTKQRDDILAEARMAVYKPKGYAGHADG